MVHGRLDQPYCAQDVDLIRPVPALLVGPDGQRADVGHHSIEATELGGHIRYPGLEHPGVADIERAAGRSHSPGRQLLDRVGHFGRVAGANGHIGALVGEGLGDRSTDALRATGDDDTLARQAEVHVMLLSRDRTC